MALLRHNQISILFIIVLLFIANVANVNAQASGAASGGQPAATLLPPPPPPPAVTQPPPPPASEPASNVGPPAQPTDSPQPQPQSEPPSQPTAPPPQQPSSPKAAPSSPAQQQKSAKQVITATNNGPVAITITSTSFVDTPTGKPNVNSANSNDNSGATGSIITAAIVVGTVVVAAAIGIWIFRKWKLTPSRNFKEKIQPVDFGPRSAESDEIFLRGLHEP